MPFADSTVGLAAANAALDAIVATLPDDGSWRLYSDVPETATELGADGGYAPVPADVADWAAAADGSVSTTVPVDFGTSTDAYSDTATYWAWADSTGEPVLWDLLPEQIGVGEADTDVSMRPTLFFRDDIF